MLGQLFLVGCVVALGSIATIFFVVFGPVPVKRRVEVVPRLAVSAPIALAPMPSLVAQLAPARQQSFTPPAPVTSPVDSAFPSTIQGAAPPVRATPRSSASIATPPPLPAPIAVTPPPTPVRSRGQKVQPKPRPQRIARGTNSPAPFAPVVRSAQRMYREEDAVTNQVQLFDTEEFTIDESR